MTSRRDFLAGTAALGLSSAIAMPSLTLAAIPGDKRFVLVILRGALDGLAALPPVGDPDYAGLRQGLALKPAGQPGGVIDLDGFFGMHPAMEALEPFYRNGQLLPVHAVAGPQRTRSHFDAQDVLENGADRAHKTQAGWLNRALAELQRGQTNRRFGLAIGYDVPLVLRGGVPVASWAPARVPPSSASLLDRLSGLYETDAVFARALNEGIAARQMAAKAMGGTMAKGGGNLRRPNRFATLVDAAGRLLAEPDGARIAVLEMGGWDTHANQGAADGRLARNLLLLSKGLASLPDRLGPLWKDTVVAVVTEFGRTVRVNGTGGTDHGTASAAFLVGGAVDGGRVAGRWPGLAASNLYQGRDLAPTTDMRGMMKGVLRDHLGLASSTLDKTVFPDSSGVRPVADLIRP